MDTYKKKYKGALARCKWLLSEGMISRIVATDLFRELMDNDSENVRREIINIFHSLAEGKIPVDINYADIFTWLEKQGEQKPTLPKWKYKKDNTTLLKDSLVLNKCGHMAKLSSGAIVSDVWVLDYDELAKLPKEELEEQGEQNPTDNVEPKFKVGDWVVNRLGNIWHIDSFDTKNYQVTTNKGEHNYFPINIQDRMHIWTIADAKDGDILVGKIDGDDYILIFKQIKDGWIETYGHYYNTVDRFCVPSQLFCRNYKGVFYPATKEQRDLLFQKMKDAGYKWDAEKKELRKIDARKNLTLDGDLMQADCMIVEQKPVWTEEDKRILDALISSLINERFAGRLEFLKGIKVSSVIDWLKSLKEKRQ